MLVEAGDMIPSDGEVIEGVASRERGGDHRRERAGDPRERRRPQRRHRRHDRASDWLVVRITANPGETFLDRMIALVEGAKRQKTPNEIALDILLAGAHDHLPARDRDAAAVLASTPSTAAGRARR